MPAVSSLSRTPANPFEEFFRDPVYLGFKNHLYNYRLRIRAIRRALKDTAEAPLLEIGSGISPVIDAGTGVIYSDISAGAMRFLHREGKAEKALAASILSLPFPAQSIGTLVCSEVLEHIPDDRRALQEIARILRPGARLILTVPAHDRFFSVDDRFVEHQRRYNPEELTRLLDESGFEGMRITRIAALLEKIAMMTAVQSFRFLSLFRGPGTFQGQTPLSSRLRWLLLPYRVINNVFGFLVALEAALLPLSCSTIILISCTRKKS